MLSDYLIRKHLGSQVLSMSHAAEESTSDELRTLSSLRTFQIHVHEPYKIGAYIVEWNRYNMYHWYALSIYDMYRWYAKIKKISGYNLINLEMKVKLSEILIIQTACSFFYQKQQHNYKYHKSLEPCSHYISFETSGPIILNLF